MSVEEHSLLRHPLHGGGQNLGFDITSLVDEFLGSHAMIDPRDSLLDDRPLVEIGGDKVRGGAGDLDAPVVGLVVGLGALERRQEAVVDVDDLAGHDLAEFRGEDLHVPRQHDEVDLVGVDEFEDPGFLLGLGVLGHGEVVEGDVVGLGERFEVGVVGDDQGNVDGELARLLPEEEVVEAVADFGHHDEDLGLLRHGTQRVVHLHGGGERVEFRGEMGRGLGWTKVHSHEELLRVAVTELLEVQDVQAVLGEDARYGVDDAWFVRAGEREDVVVGHFGEDRL